MHAQSSSLRIFTLMIVWVSGCALNQSGTREVSAVLESQANSPPRMAARYAPTSRPVLTTRPAPGPASLQDFIALALQNNPEISAGRQTALAKAQRIPQVTALPDPVLATKTFLGDRPMMYADGNSFFTMAVTQQLPFPEKLDRAGRMALEETRMALQELRQTQLRVVADVKRAWFQIYILDQSMRITQDNKNLLSDLIAVARIQVSANNRPQDDLLRAQVELSNLERELIEQRQNRTTAAATLNTLVNRPPYRPIPSPPSFDLRQTDLKIDALLTQACKTNPELLRFQHQIERDRQARKLAQLGYWPDVSLGLEWTSIVPRKPFQPPADPTTGFRPAVDPLSTEQRDNYGLIVEMNLPIWLQKTQAAIRESEYNLGASIDRYHSAQNLVNFRIQDSLARVQAQKELVEILKNTIIPQARQAYEVSRAGYTAGKSDFTSLIDGWQKTLTFTIQYHRALGELQRSLADLEQEIGTSLSRMEK
jgi:outer membrane protein, heavy metal efflux system